MFLRLSSFRLNPVQLTWVAALFFTTWVIFRCGKHCGRMLSSPVFSRCSSLSACRVSSCCINLFLTPVMMLPYLRKPLLAGLVVISAGLLTSCFATTYLSTTAGCRIFLKARRRLNLKFTFLSAFGALPAFSWSLTWWW